MLLLCYPLLGGLHAAGTAPFTFAALTEIFGVRAVSRLTAITANAHGAGAAGEHALNDQFGPFGDSMTAIDEKATPAVINLKEAFCGAGNTYARNYSGRRLLRTAIDLPSLSSVAGGYCLPGSDRQDRWLSEPAVFSRDGPFVPATAKTPGGNVPRGLLAA